MKSDILWYSSPKAQKVAGEIALKFVDAMEASHEAGETMPRDMLVSILGLLISTTRAVAIPDSVVLEALVPAFYAAVPDMTTLDARDPGGVQ